MLKNHSHLLSEQVIVHTPVRDTLFLKPDFSSAHLLNRIHASQKRALSGTGRTDDSHHLSRHNVQIDFFQNLQGAIIF